VLVALLGLCAAAFCADPDPPARVPRFSDFPFDQWAAAPDHSAIKWEVHLLPPVLSPHQRLLQRIQVVVPGSELEKRRGSGEIVVLARFEDSDGRQWRTANRLNLANVQPGVKSQELTFTLTAFVRPGSYRVLVALAFHKAGESGEMEHNFTRRSLHVAAIRNDPLPEAWQSLPPVEVLPPVDGADAWFLPDVKGRQSLPLKGTAPQIDLLVNMTPSERSSNGASAQRRNMASVIPALKVLSDLNAATRPPSFAAIDLTHHRIGYETRNAAALDWRALAKALTDNNPGIIDAKSLAAQASIRDYFAREMARRAGASGPPRWLIILSGPMAFFGQEETPLPELPPDPNRHIVYLRSGQVGAGWSGRNWSGCAHCSNGKDSRPNAGISHDHSGRPRARRGRDGCCVSRRSGTRPEADGCPGDPDCDAGDFSQGAGAADAGYCGWRRTGSAVGAGGPVNNSRGFCPEWTSIDRISVAHFFVSVLGGLCHRKLATSG